MKNNPIKNHLNYLRKHLIWLLLLLCVDVFHIFLLWLADVRAFRLLTATVLLGSLFFFVLILGWRCKKEKEAEQAFLEFLSNPRESWQEEISEMVSPKEREIIGKIGEILRENQQEQAQLSARINDYEDYVEGWAHEIKTPISLLTLVVDNRREHLPEGVFYKLNYVRNQLQESVGQMLYYARLKAPQKDYLFEPLLLEECLREVLEDYEPLLEEKDFRIIQEVPCVTIFSDRRGLVFLLSQLVSNAIKYCRNSQQPILCFRLEEESNTWILRIKDNGMGVRACDLPFLFEKGFTGDTGITRKKATGMGLYLAKEMADDLKIALDIQSQWGKGFEICLGFPAVDPGKGGQNHLKKS